MRVPNLCRWLGCNKPWRGPRRSASPGCGHRPRLPPPPRPPPLVALRPPPPRRPQRKPRRNEISASRQLTAEHPGRSQAGGGRPLSRLRSPRGLQMESGLPAAPGRRKSPASRRPQPPHGPGGGVAGVFVGSRSSPNLSPVLARPP